MTSTTRRVIGAIMWLSLSGLCAAVLSLAGVYLYLDPQVPKAETYRNVKLETPLRIFTADGGLLAEFGERRLIPLKLDEVPQQFINALLDTEDKRFYQHSGIDFISLTNDTFGLLGSLLFDGELGPGASTITMQLARNVSFGLERKFLRKFKEMLLALKVERELSKNEILELYINLVPFGKRAYGAQAAALTYYGKPLENLSLAQLAMLAGIPQAPTAGNPINGPERALRRRNLVLSRMLDQGSITQAEYAQAVAEPITASVYDRSLDVSAPYVAEWVRQQLIYDVTDLYTGGFEVVTTVNGAMQAEATRALRRGLISYDQRHGYRGPAGTVDAKALESSEDPALLMREALREYPVRSYAEAVGVLNVDEQAATLIRLDGSSVTLDLPAVEWARRYLTVDSRGAAPQRVADVLNAGDIVWISESEAGTWQLTQIPELQGSLIALDPENGQVLALDGGFDFSISEYNHALQAARQPGSGFKPFVYSAALEHGVTPASIFMDAPLVFDDEHLESEYRPDNDNNRYNGPTRLREALYRSINLVSMRVLLQVGASSVIEHAQHLQFDTTSFPRNTQLAIGGGTMAITPMEMARAYAAIANGGYLIEPHVIAQVIDRDGKVIRAPIHPVVCRTCDEHALEPESETEAAAETETETETETKEIAAAEELRPPPAATRVLDARNAFIMHTMLQDVVRRGTATRAKSLERGDLAGKTGTTNDAADTWFNGYAGGIVANVWTGFDTLQPLGAREYGSTTPLPIWIDFMADALAGRPEYHPVQPPGLVTMKINPQTGEATLPLDPGGIFEFFYAENAPKLDLDKPALLPTTDGGTGEDVLVPVDLF